jgi:nucleoside 2-deoxyribosyltransferase
MAMDPKNPELPDTYRTIQTVYSEFGLQALRIDDFEHTETITARVLAEIEACPYAIADLTGERPNVYYEIGFAHGLKRSPILFRKAGTQLHFDLSVHKVPEYKGTPPKVGLPFNASSP